MRSKPVLFPDLILFSNEGSGSEDKALVSKLVDPTGVLKYGYPGSVNDKLKEISLYGTYDCRTRNPV